MFVRKNLSLRGILTFTGGHIVWMTLWVLFVLGIHELTHSELMHVPWVPVSIIGTAVAFYIGFKNNQSYDRLWEARKIWGAIVNSSRSWGAMVKAYVTDQFVVESIPEEELKSIKQRLIYRHIAWLYALRSQLLIPTEWEHLSQGWHVGRHAERLKNKFGVGLLDTDGCQDTLRQYLPADEYDTLINYKNTATQIIARQAIDLQELRGKSLIEDFRHIHLQDVLNEFYVHQGKAERIKKFPLPRQYGGMGSVFVGIFIFILPFAMVTTFHAEDLNIFMMVPLTVLISWVYLTMELVGDYSENPFEGLANDIPMLSLCRVIETDLLEMLGEEDIPPPITPINGVLH